MESIDIFFIYHLYFVICKKIDKKIHSKLQDLSNIGEDLDGQSAFDEIDKSEEYNIEYDLDKDIYSMRIETIYNYVKYSTLYLKDSHIESMNCDLEYLLDFIYYNKINFEEKDNYDDFY